ncbi:MAG: hypothetical protein IE926_01715 [Micrococcales bacterium]|uniref:hypothetical protein n=1 Tax=Phycicoccus sp. TaxID=1902410 RepID=UPI0019A8567D|nr:hypothetical protein [Phycicoccus sp.]MBD3781661.1 hypothetical protein [Micrococcales bacterium]HMM94168.1 hypothetical protein [Phycicoccus sp.]
MTKTTTLWTSVKDDLRERREQRAAARRLREDLAHYRTPHEIEDLLAAVDAQDTPDAPSADAVLIRSILQDNLQAYYGQQAPARRAAGF